jgi:predicted ABC-type transport system involved in lysophospholipase L1 biosynthesis ATPase subunit
VKRAFRWLLLLVTVVASATAVWRFIRPEPVTVSLYRVTHGPVASTVANTRVGTVKACRRSNVAPATGGEVLLADEPTGNLDRTTGKEVVQLLEGLNEKGMILLLVTHDQELGGRASRQIRMIDGRIAEDESMGLN